MALTNSQKWAFNYYVSQGFSPVQAAGMVARLSVESGPTLNPGAKGDGGAAFGLAQWHPDRWGRIEAWARSQGLDPTSREAQLKAVPWELQNHEQQAWAMLQKAQDPQSAYAAMMAYERPGGWTAQNPAAGNGWNTGLSWAQQLAGVTPGAPGQDPGTEYTGAAGSVPNGDRPSQTTPAGMTNPPVVNSGDNSGPNWGQLGDYGMRLLQYQEEQRRKRQQAPNMLPLLYGGGPTPGLLGGGF